MYQAPTLIALTLSLIATIPVFAAKFQKSSPQPTIAPITAKNITEEREAGATTRTKVVPAREIFKKIGISGYYNLSDSASYEASVGNQSLSGTIKTTSSYGIGADLFLKTLDNGVNLKAMASYEFPRTFNSMSWRSKDQSGTVSLENPKPALSLWLMGLQGEIFVGDGITLFAGGNFSFPTLKNNPGSYSGKIGWHAGATLLVADNFYLDGIWRSVNISGSQDQLTFDNMNIAGMMVRGRMTFQ